MSPTIGHRKFGPCFKAAVFHIICIRTSQHYGIEGIKETPQLAPIMPRDADTLSDGVAGFAGLVMILLALIKELLLM